MKNIQLNKNFYLLIFLILSPLIHSCNNDQNNGLLKKNIAIVTVTTPSDTHNCYIYGELTRDKYIRMSAIGDNKFQVKIYNTDKYATYKYYSAENKDAVERDEFGNEVDERRLSENDIVTSWKTVSPIGIRYNVIVPEGTIECYIAGDFTGWHHKQMEPIKGQINKFSIHFKDASENQSYKYCSGPEWEFEELDINESPIKNRTYSENDTVLKWRDIYVPGQEKPYTYLETAIPLIPYIDDSRRIWVYVPSDYKDNLDKKYPVFYMHDGQNIFENGGFGSWNMHKAMQQLESEGFETGIVVAINNSNDRLQEYAPFAHKDYAPNAKGTEYIEAIINNIMPWVNANYRTLTDPQNTGIGGSSMGGLISYFGAMKYPNIFGKAAVISPSFWLCNTDLTNYVENYDGDIKNSKMYFICGDNEGSSDIISDMERKYKETLAKSLKESNVKFEVVSDGKHNESSWANQIARVYRFLYSD